MGIRIQASTINADPLRIQNTALRGLSHEMDMAFEDKHRQFHALTEDAVSF
jgi:hypothetical protein